MKNIKTFYFFSIIFISIIFMSDLYAQSSDELTFKNFAIEQGLSNNDVKAIVQSVDGYIWIGAMNGLNRYDGYEFKYYQNDPNDPNSISGNSVWSIFEDHLHNLWVGTQSGLNLFHKQTNTFTRFQHDEKDPASISNNTIYCINEDPEGNIWFGSYFKGLNLFDRTTQSFKHFLHDPGDSLSLSHNSVRVIYFDSQQTMWVGTRNGLNKFDDATQTFIRFKHDPKDAHSLSSDFVNSICEDGRGNIWVGTRGNGLNIYDRKRNEFMRISHDPDDVKTISSNGIREIFKDKNGNLWIGTIKGICKYNDKENSFTNYTHNSENPNSLINNIVKEISEDENGNLWIGSYLGISMISNKKKQIDHFIPEDKKSKNHKRNWIWAITEDPTGNLWVGSWDGLFQYDSQRKLINYIEAKANDHSKLNYRSILCIYADKEGMIWIGTYSGGLNKYDPKTRTFKYFKNDPDDQNSISHNQIRCLIEDKYGDLWIGTAKGLNRMDKKAENFTRYFADPDNPYALQHDYVWSLSEDKNGIIWIGTQGDLHQYIPETKRFNVFDYDPGNEKSDVHFITQSPEGNLLFMGRGLSYLYLESGKLSQFKRTDGILNKDGCSSTLIDEKGFFWVTDGKGLLKLDPKTKEFRRFDKTDGIQDSVFNGSSCYKGGDGILYFGGPNGFNSFHPDSISVSGYKPNVVLTNFQLFNKDVPLTGNIKDSVSNELIYTLPHTIQYMERLSLPYNAFVMSFEYASMDFANPEKNEYQFMLENFEEEWNKVRNQRKATYTNLSPGDYVFKVKGTNNDGVWSTREIYLPITIQPPWWLTWWMKTIYWMLGIGIPFVIYFGRVNALKKQRAKLRLQVIERTKEVVQQKEEIENQAEELKQTNEKLLELDDFKQGMTGMIVHDLKNPLNSILNLAEQPALKQAGKHMLNMVMNILDVQKFEDSKMVIEGQNQVLLKVAEKSVQQVKFLSNQKNISIHNLILPQATVIIDAEIIERVFVNLLTNCIKYTPNNGEISLNCRNDAEGYVRIEVKDTGEGIPADKLDQIFEKFGQVKIKKSGEIRSTGLGLTFCKLAVEAHDCKIGVNSDIGKGTVFWFTLPEIKVSNNADIYEPSTASEDLQINLTEEDKKILLTVVNKLKNHKVYEISLLLKELKEIDISGSNDLKRWEETLLEVVYAGNQERYHELLEIVLK